MSKIIHQQDIIYITKDQTSLYVDRGKPVTVRSRSNVYVKDNAVTHIVSCMKMGLNKHSGKRYARWENDSLVSVRRTSTGKVAVLIRSGAKVYGGFGTPFTLGTADEETAFKDALKNELGVGTVADIYPAARIFDFANGDIDFSYARLLNAAVSNMAYRRRANSHRSITNRAVSRTVAKILYNDDPREMVSLLTGHEYRKDIARAMRTVGINHIGEMKHLKGIEPNMVAPILSMANENNYGNYFLRGQSLLHLMLKDEQISRQRYLKLITDPAAGSVFVYDLRRMLTTELSLAESREFMRNRDIRTAHDELAEIINERKHAHLNKAIEYTPEVVSIDGAQVGDYTIALAKDGTQIRTWGREQGHCIGSYADDAYNRGAVLAAVMQGDKMVANFHLSKTFTANPFHDTYRLTQIYAKHNAMFDGAQAVHDFLVEQGVIVPSQQAGGMPRPTATDTWNVAVDMGGNRMRIREENLNRMRIRAENLQAQQLRVNYIA